MAARDFDLEEAAGLVCERYRLAVAALALTGDADLSDGMSRDHAAVASVAHLRALDEFLFKDRTKNTRATDVRAVDFAPGWLAGERGATVPGIVDMGDQRIAHITMRRASTGSTFWNPKGMLHLLVQSMGFFIRDLDDDDPSRAAWFLPTHEAMSAHPLLVEGLDPVRRHVPTSAGAVKVYRWRPATPRD